LTIAEHCPLSVETTTGDGQAIIGASASFTFTTKALAKLFPAASSAVQLTDVTPLRKVVPDAGEQFMLPVVQLSEKDGAV